MEKVIEGALLIFYLVKKLKEKYPEKQIGKTLIQKMMYLFGESSKKDFEYTMYHYGPYSFEISEYINLSENLNLIKVNWVPNKGYYIEPESNFEINGKLTSEKLKKIEELIEKFGHFSANELAIITTALYVKKNFGIEKNEEIIRTVLSLKPNNEKDWIESILKKAKIIV
ncbi:MAG: hypothetical protein H0Z24_07495 [Thermosipho sp. (in: Bacteria)]|nr:hypothetical protein [Thermosipho sp. (in: thermotogales)]